MSVIWCYSEVFSDNNLGYYITSLASLVVQTVKIPTTMWETWVQPLGSEDLLEKDMATHSSILA